MSAKYVLEFRHRPNLYDEIRVRHKRFLSNQSDLPEAWKIPDEGSTAPSDIAGELSSIVSLNGALGKGLKGEIVYQLRNESYLRDEAQYDDSFAIEFNAKKVNYSDLVLKIFPKFVTAFESYRATIYEKSMARLDWANIVRESRNSGRDVNGRDGVYRINAVNYFDRELCRRAFSLLPEQVVDCLKGKVESVSLLGDGVLLIYSSELMENRDLEKIDSELRSLLHG